MQNPERNRSDSVRQLNQKLPYCPKQPRQTRGLQPCFPDKQFSQSKENDLHVREATPSSHYNTSYNRGNGRLRLRLGAEARVGQTCSCCARPGTAGELEEPNFNLPGRRKVGFTSYQNPGWFPKPKAVYRDNCQEGWRGNCSECDPGSSRESWRRGYTKPAGRGRGQSERDLFDSDGTEFADTCCESLRIPQGEAHSNPRSRVRRAEKPEVVLIISGNLSFLNWLTIVPSVACFDDAALGFLFGFKDESIKRQVCKIQTKELAGEKCSPRRGSFIRQVMNISLAVLLAYLSIPVMQNLLNPKQVMNTSFNPLRIVNTYGAFGSITKERTEVIIQGTYSEDPNDASAVWQEYAFNCKPGDMTWRPCLITPYHYRLDWLMWFAAFQTYEQNEWIIHLAGKLLANDSRALSLLQRNPFEGKKPPRWIRGEHFKYRFSQLGGRHAAEGKWWIRRRIGPYFPPVNLKGLKRFFETRDWSHPHGS